MMATIPPIPSHPEGARGELDGRASEPPHALARRRVPSNLVHLLNPHSPTHYETTAPVTRLPMEPFRTNPIIGAAAPASAIRLHATRAIVRPTCQQATLDTTSIGRLVVP